MPFTLFGGRATKINYTEKRRYPLMLTSPLQDLVVHPQGVLNPNPPAPLAEDFVLCAEVAASRGPMLERPAWSKLKPEHLPGTVLRNPRE